jgi:hypothetical protein
MPHATNIEDDISAQIPRSAEPPSEPPSQLLNAVSKFEQYGQERLVPQDVQAQLHYLSPSFEVSKNSPPVQVVTRSSTTRDARTTVRISQGPVEIVHDVRGRENDFSLERNGFKFVRNRCKFQDWESRDGIWTGYIEELKELVSREFGGAQGGVDEVIAFHEGVS